MMNLALVIFGIIGLLTLSVRELPDIDPPIVTVTTVYPGANARIIETEVTEKIEDAVSAIEGIRELTSESREQVSTVTVEFNLARPIEIATQDVRDRIARIRDNLPADINEPIVAKQEADASPMMWVALSSPERETVELTELGETFLKDRLQSVGGVSSVMLGGSKRFAIRLRLDSEKMAAHRVTVGDVETALLQQNVELPAGRVEGLDRELSIEALGQISTAEEFNRLVITRRGTSFIRLADIGHAEEGVEDERTIARYNGNPTIGLGIVRQSKANVIEVARGVKQELENLRDLLPPDVETIVAYDESIFIEDSIRQVWITLFVAFILVVLTIFIFLGTARAVVVPAVSIPVSILGTFAVLSAMGFSVNILTMLALVLAIGIVVDDSIIVLENIYRYIEKGLAPMQAAKKGIGEIAFAVIATTLSLVAVFVPLAFQTSLTGRLFVEFAIALSGAVVISSFVALSLTPVLASRILSARAGRSLARYRFLDNFESFFSRLRQRYENGLKWSLSRPRAIGGVALASVAGGIFFFYMLESEFLPLEDKGRLLAFAMAPEGSTFEYTDKVVREMEVIAGETPEISGYFSAVALAFAGPGRANQGLMFMKLDEKSGRRHVTDVVYGMNGLFPRFFNEISAALVIPIIPTSMARSLGQQFQLVLQYRDLAELENTGQDIISKLTNTGMLRNLRANFEISKPELSVVIDRDRAAALGVSMHEVARTLQILFGGSDLSKINLDGREYQVIVQLLRESRANPADLEKVYVKNQSGELVQLSNIGKFKETTGPNLIARHNRLRSMTIEGSPAGVTLGRVVEEVEQLLRSELPGGFRYEWAGEVRDLKSSQREIYWIFFLAIIIVYMVLASQFESLVHPLTVLVALPLSWLGAFGALWFLSLVNFAGTILHAIATFSEDPSWLVKILSSLVPRIPAMTFNLYSQIGLVLLVGLVTKNSILLVEFANRRVAEGVSAAQAMLEAAVIRFRPILMTAIGTVAGILPIAIGFGMGAESRRPLGVAIVGGILVSTFLTLFVIPVIYCAMANFASKLKNNIGKFK
jgi:hydrophobe/amphiphile efflux-1 (HAE1) family protein